MKKIMRLSVLVCVCFLAVINLVGCGRGVSENSLASVKEESPMLPKAYLFNYQSIRSVTGYSCKVNGKKVEKELSFHVDLGPSTERRGDVFPIYQVPEGKMVWLSDWSFNVTGGALQESTVGGSLGRITTGGNYIYVLNCSTHSREMDIFSPARSIRYLPGEWIAVCFHQLGGQIDLKARAGFRFIEVPSEGDEFQTEVFGWGAKNKEDIFPGIAQPKW